MAKKQELAKREPPAAPLATREAGWGFENVRPGDYIIPRIGICQAMSPERKKSNDRYIEGLKEGEFFNSLMKTRLGPKIRVIPVHHFGTRIKWRGEIGEGMDCRSFDGRVGVGVPGGACGVCPCAQFRQDGKGKTQRPECTDFYNVAVIVMPDKGMPKPEDLAVLSFKSTAITEAKQWLSRMRLVSPVIAAGIHEVTTTERHNDSGDWYTPVVSPAGLTSPEQLAFAYGLHKMMRDAEAAGRPIPVEEPHPDDGTGREPGDDRDEFPPRE